MSVFLSHKFTIISNFQRHRIDHAFELLQINSEIYLGEYEELNIFLKEKLMRTPLANVKIYINLVTKILTNNRLTVEETVETHILV